MKFTSTAAKLASLILAMLVVLAMSSNAFAEPKRSNGGSCDSTGTARKDGKDEAGNKMNCQWDTCTYTECSTSGGTVSNCVKKTEYSNPSDCHAAATTHGSQSLTQLGNIGLQMENPTGGGGANPTAPTHGFLISLKAAISETDLRQACDKAAGLFSAGSKTYQCLSVDGDILSCRVGTHYCTGSLVDHKRPPTLLGFATAPFGKGADEVPDAPDTGGHGSKGKTTPPPPDKTPDPPPVLY